MAQVIWAKGGSLCVCLAAMTAGSDAGGFGAPRRRLRGKVSSRVGSPLQLLQPAQLQRLSSVDKLESVAVSAVKTGGAAASSAPRFVLKERHPEYVIVGSALDQAMLEKLEQFLKRKRPQPAKMKNEGGNSDDERKARYDDRDSLVSWFNAKIECDWLHERLADIIRQIGNVEWRLLKVDSDGNCICEYEPTQYAVYGDGQHFKAWHQDAYADGNDPEDARQFTIVLMISEKRAYTGGQFEAKLKGPSGKKVLRRLRLDAGDALVFPAKRLVHRVSAVKKGTRKTLVFWANDKFSSRYHRRQMGLSVEKDD